MGVSGSDRLQVRWEVALFSLHVRIWNVWLFLFVNFAQCFVGVVWLLLGFGFVIRSCTLLRDYQSMNQSILSKFLFHPTTIQKLSLVNMVIPFLCLVVWLLLPTDNDLSSINLAFIFPSVQVFHIERWCLYRLNFHTFSDDAKPNISMCDYSPYFAFLMEPVDHCFREFIVIIWRRHMMTFD